MALNSKTGEAEALIALEIQAPRQTADDDSGATVSTSDWVQAAKLAGEEIHDAANFAQQVFAIITDFRREALSRERLPDRLTLEPLLHPLSKTLQTALDALTKIHEASDLSSAQAKARAEKVWRRKENFRLWTKAVHKLRLLPEEADIALGVDADPPGCIEDLERVVLVWSSGKQMIEAEAEMKAARASVSALIQLIEKKLSTGETLAPRFMSESQKAAQIEADRVARVKVEVIKADRKARERSSTFNQEREHWIKVKIARTGQDLRVKVEGGIESRTVLEEHRLTDNLRALFTQDVLNIAVSFGMVPTAWTHDNGTMSEAVALMVTAGKLAGIDIKPGTWEEYVRSYIKTQST